MSIRKLAMIGQWLRLKHGVEVGPLERQASKASVRRGGFKEGYMIGSRLVMLVLFNLNQIASIMTAPEYDMPARGIAVVCTKHF
jgi:hypothetical protein